MGASYSRLSDNDPTLTIGEQKPKKRWRYKGLLIAIIVILVVIVAASAGVGGSYAVKHKNAAPK